MKQITKKEFKKIYRSLRLASSTNHDLQFVKDRLKKFLEQSELTLDNTKEVTNIELSNQNDYITTKIYRDGSIYYAETIIDNSKCPTCSWNYKQYVTTVYCKL